MQAADAITVPQTHLEVVPAFAQEAAALDDRDALEALFSQTVRSMGYHGFDAWAVTRGTFGDVQQPQNLYAADYTYDVITKFLASDFAGSCPVTAHAAKTAQPFDYLEVLNDAPSNGSVLFQKATLALFNVHHAWITPLNTVDQMRGTTLYLKGKGPHVTQHFRATRMAAQLLSSEFMAAFIRVNAPEPSVPGETPNVKLSNREAECMTWIARGKTNWETAQILGISENTVRFHLKNAFRKLDATSRPSAVMRAVQAGLIAP